MEPAEPDAEQMVDLLTLRNKILVVGGLPAVVLLLVCAVAAAGGSPLVAGLALVGLLPSLALALVVSGAVVHQVDGLIGRAAQLAGPERDPGPAPSADRLAHLGTV